MKNTEKQKAYREKEKIKRGVQGFLRRLSKMPEHELSAYIDAVISWKFGIDYTKKVNHILFISNIHTDEEVRVRVNSVRDSLDSLLRFIIPNPDEESSSNNPQRAEEDKNPYFIRPIKP